MNGMEWFNEVTEWIQECPSGCVILCHADGTYFPPFQDVQTIVNHLSENRSRIVRIAFVHHYVDSDERRNAIYSGDA
jgi:glucose/arabinose dehydrogenase